MVHSLRGSLLIEHDTAQRDHWSECGRSMSLADSSAAGRPHRSVLALGRDTSMKKWSIIFGASLMVASVSAQWVPDGPPPDPWAVEWVVAGGISYIRVTSLLPAGTCCQRIAGYAVSREGSHFIQTVQHETWQGTCPDLFCDSRPDETVAVLGAIAPGNYIVTLAAQTNALGPATPYFSPAFQVPTNPYPTMLVTPATNGPSIAIQVNGIPKVLYVLETSKNLTNWTALATNMTSSDFAPITFSVPTTNGPYGFYRTQIMQAPPRAGL